jgi:hypothetical protein
MTWPGSWAWIKWLRVPRRGRLGARGRAAELRGCGFLFCNLAGNPALPKPLPMRSAPGRQGSQSVHHEQSGRGADPYLAPEENTLHRHEKQEVSKSGESPSWPGIPCVVKLGGLGSPFDFGGHGWDAIRFACGHRSRRIATAPATWKACGASCPARSRGGISDRGWGRWRRKRG